MKLQSQTNPVTTVGSTPVAARLLRQKCACGQHTGGGECAECSKKRRAETALGGMPQRRGVGNREPAEAPPIVHDVLRSPSQLLDAATRASFEPRFGHDFSRVRAHHGVAHIIHAGDPDSPNPDSPDSSPQEIPADAADAGAPSLPVELTYSTVSRQKGVCGDFDWVVNWILKNVKPTTQGFIVQKVTSDMFTQDCADDQKFDSQFDFWWEAWQVRNGQIFSGTSTKPSLGDEFRISNTLGGRGSTLMSGEAKFMEGYGEPLNWGTYKPAGPLKATTTEPPGWSNTGNKRRVIAIQSYDCCSGMNEDSKMDVEETTT